MALVPVEEDSSPRKGRRRGDWQPVAEIQLEEATTLRKAGQGWLASEKILHKTLTASSNDGAATLIARCDKCIGCSRQFCFSWIAEKHLRVERRGEHNGTPNLARLKRVHAKEYAKSHTPLHALKAMRQSGVPASERPKTTQLKVQRPGGSCKPSGEYSVQCRLDLENFAKDPPAGVSVFEEHFICTAERVQLAFELKLEGVDAMLKEKQFHSFLMDYTFSTCREGLLLGAIGPVGVQMTRSGPRMRFFRHTLPFPARKMRMRSVCCLTCSWTSPTNSNCHGLTGFSTAPTCTPSRRLSWSMAWRSDATDVCNTFFGCVSEVWFPMGDTP